MERLEGNEHYKVIAPTFRSLATKFIDMQRSVGETQDDVLEFITDDFPDMRHQLDYHGSNYSERFVAETVVPTAAAGADPDPSERSVAGPVAPTAEQVEEVRLIAAAVDASAAAVAAALARTRPVLTAVPNRCTDVRLGANYVEPPPRARLVAAAAVPALAQARQTQGTSSETPRPKALLRPSRPRATWLEHGYIRAANPDPLCPPPNGRATLTANFPTKFLKGQRPAGANATGVWHTHDYYKRVSKAMNKALRHFPLTFVALPTSRI